MKTSFLAGLIAGWISMSAAMASEYTQHLIVVLDDSGTVQDDTGHGARARPSFMIARRAMVAKINNDFSRKDLVTIVSVARSQVIWQGPATEITDRRNFVLADYLNADLNGCADFMRVVSTIQRELLYSEVPLAKLIFLSSLVHTNTTPEGCEVDPENLQPPETFFKQLESLQFETKAELSFLWTYDEVAPAVADFFDEKGIRVILKQEKLTAAELSR